MNLPDALLASAVPPRVPLDQLRAAGAALHRELERQVHAQRLAGASWAAVGAWLGCGRSAAHERWRYLDALGVEMVVGVAGGLVYRGEGSGVPVTSGDVEYVRRFGILPLPRPAIEAQP